MSADTHTAYLLVLVIAVVLPGPANTLIVANGMRHGARAALLNVSGTQLGGTFLMRWTLARPLARQIERE